MKIYIAFYRVTFIIAFILFLPFSPEAKEQKGKGEGTAKVAVAEVGTGLMDPQAEFTGTVYFSEVSDVACEVEGRADHIGFEEGERVKKGSTLVTLNADLLRKELNAKKALHQQVSAELEKARADLKRVENLRKEEAIAEQLYDEHSFRVKGLEGKAASIDADVEGLKLEIGKKSVKAPFDGIVIKREVERGEWCNEGATAAVIAKDSVVDIVLDVPEEMLIYISKGMGIDLKAGGRNFRGKVFAVIPRGDVLTRTFPVKIRAANNFDLKEGMEATASLPTGRKVEATTVPRDAVITKFGKTVIFAIKDSKAVMIPAKIVGYAGLLAGIRAEGLEAGMKVIIKGNERIREGQAVEIVDNSP